MKKYKIMFSLLLMLSSVITRAQGPEMADTFRSEGKIYVVVAVMSIIFLGIAIFLVVLERRIRRMEKEMKAKQ